MSCPDWTSLTEHRRTNAPEPEGWSEALAHFDSGCPLCRKQALKGDPTLVFRRLPPVSASAMTETQEQAEVESVRQAVAAMRAASRLDSREPRRSTSSGWKRWAAAAGLGLAALSLPWHGQQAGRQEGRDGETAAIFREGRVDRVAEALGAGGLVADAPANQQVAQDSFVVEGVSLPGDRDSARVYEMNGGDLSVVMIVDESFVDI